MPGEWNGDLKKNWTDFLIGCWKHWILNIFNILRCLDSVWRVSGWCFDWLWIFCQWFENGISSENWSIWIMLFNAAFPPYAHHNATHHIDFRVSGRCLEGVWVTLDTVWRVIMPNQLTKVQKASFWSAGSFTPSGFKLANIAEKMKM